MIYKLIENPDGEYTNGNKNYDILEAQYWIDSPEGRNIGCYEMTDLETAMQFYNVTKKEPIIE